MIRLRSLFLKLAVSINFSEKTQPSLFVGFATDAFNSPKWTLFPFEDESAAQALS
jgi:hypothetical protein